MPLDRHARSSGPLVRIDRPRLDARLTGRTQPVAVLVGPPGSGKSELLRPLRDRTDTFWFAAGNEHATFARFVRGLAQTVAVEAPGALASFPRAWERALQYGSPGTVLAHWLCEHLHGVDNHLVIDDLHHAADDPNIGAFLGRLCELRPHAMLTIAARTIGTLPVALWMATGRMERPINESDLRFDCAEIGAAARWFGLDLDGPAQQALYEATGGSAIAVQYALTRRCNEPGGAPEAAVPASFDAMAVEMFARRSGAERAFLFSACSYPAVNDDLLRLAGWDDAPALRLAIGSDAAFMWDIDAGGAIRFHDRFRDFLERELATYDGDFQTTIARRTVETLKLAGRHAEALEVATRRKRTDAMSDLLDVHGFELLESGEIDAITEALDALGSAAPKLGAKAVALRGYLDARRGRLDTAEAWFQLGLQTAEDDVSRVAIGMYYAHELALRRRADACDVLAPFVDSPTLPRAMLTDVRSSYAQALTAANRLDEAAARTADALAMLDAAASPALRARVYARAAYVAVEASAFETARERALIAAPLAIAQSLYDVAASTYSVLYNIAFEIEDDAVASLSYLRNVRDLGVKSGTLRLELYALLGMYDLQAEAGDEAALTDLDRQIAALDKHDAGVQIIEGLLPARALQAGWAGDFGVAARILRPSAAAAATPARRARCWAQIALYCAAEAEPDGAAEAIAAARTELVDVDIETAHVRMTWLIVALAAWTAGRKAEAFECVAAADAVHGASSPRIAALRAVLTTLLTGSASAGNFIGNVAAALADLRSCAFGGMAKLIEALPYRDVRPAERNETIGSLLAKAELPERFTAAVAADDAGPLHEWLDSLRGTVLDEVAVAERFEEWAAGQNRFDPATRAAISKVRRQLTAYRRRAPAFLRLVDDIDTSINALFEHLDAAAPLMAEHSRAVSAWCSRLARALDLTEGEIDFVTRGGLIHDIGKMRTPGEILHAPRHLTPDEWIIMQAHAAEGGQIISSVPILRPFVPIVRGHHERLDGRGYPDGLRLGAIPLAARIVSVADAFNAMIGRRPYRAPMAPTDALAELRRNAHTQFDPEIVEAMVRIVQGRVSEATLASV